MIQAVTSSRYPYLPVHVQIITQGAIAYEFDIEPAVDTGFDGGLTVSSNVIPSHIPAFGHSDWKLADETEIRLPVYSAYVKIGNLTRVPTLVLVLGQDPLLGRHVIDNFRLIFDHGTQLTVEP